MSEAIANANQAGVSRPGEPVSAPADAAQDSWLAVPRHRWLAYWQWAADCPHAPPYLHRGQYPPGWDGPSSPRNYVDLDQPGGVRLVRLPASAQPDLTQWLATEFGETPVQLPEVRLDGVPVVIAMPQDQPAVPAKPGCWLLGRPGEPAWATVLDHLQADPGFPGLLDRVGGLVEQGTLEQLFGDLHLVAVPAAAWDRVHHLLALRVALTFVPGLTMLGAPVWLVAGRCDDEDPGEPLAGA